MNGQGIVIVDDALCILADDALRILARIRKEIMNMVCASVRSSQHGPSSSEERMEVNMRVFWSITGSKTSRGSSIHGSASVPLEGGLLFKDNNKDGGKTFSIGSRIKL